MRSKEVEDAIMYIQDHLDFFITEKVNIERDLIETVLAYISELEEKSKKCEYYEEVADTLYKNSINKDKIRAKINNMFEIYHERYELDFEEVRQLISEIHGNVLKELEGE